MKQQVETFELHIREIEESDYYALADGGIRKICRVETTLGLFEFVEAADRSGERRFVVTASRHRGGESYFLLELPAFYELIKLWVLSQEENFDAVVTSQEKPRTVLVNALNQLLGE